MNLLKKLFKFFVLFIGFQSNIAAEEQEVIDDSLFRSTSHQQTHKISSLEIRVSNNETRLDDHETRITDLEVSSGSMASASTIHNLAIYNSLLSEDVERIVVFNADVTTDTTNQFTLATTDQVAVVGSTVTTLTAAAGGITGIDFSNFDNFQSAVGSLNIDTHTIINAHLTVNESITIQGNLVVNGNVTVAAGKTLTVQGDAIFDGKCAYILVNNGTITATGKIIIQNYKNSSGAAVTNNVGATISSTATDCDGTITFKNNIGSTVGVVNTGAGATITSSKDIIFEKNIGSDQGIFNDTSAVIMTTGTGSIFFRDNQATDMGGYGVENSGGTATIQAAVDVTFMNNKGDVGGVINTGSGVTIEAAGNVYFEKTSGGDQGVANESSAVIISSGAGSIYFRDNQATDGGSGVENSGGTATIQAAVGAVKFINNKGADVGVKNTGAGVRIEAAEDVIFEKNSGADQGILNENDAVIASTGLGSVCFIANEGTGAGGNGVENAIGTAKIEAVGGEIKFIKNKGDANGVVNTGASVEIEAAGSILFEQNSGDERGVFNTTGATIQSTAGCVMFDGNQGTGAGSIGVENTTSLATIKTVAGQVSFSNNKGLDSGVLNNLTGLIESSHNILFDGNRGRDGSGVRNDNGGIIRATAANSVIYFKCNIGRDYGVRNHASISGTSEIRTTNATAFPNNKTRIIFNGNSGAEHDTFNNSELGTANIIAGAASGIIGNGKVCYDAQSNIEIAAGNVSPQAVVCAKDEELESPIIGTIQVDSTLNKTIVFDTSVTMDSTGGGTLTLGTGNELTVLALLTDKAGIQTVVAVDSGTINPANYPTLDLTTGGSNIFDADIIVNDNFTVNENLTITGNVTIKGGSLMVATGKTLTIFGDLLAHGLDMDRQVLIAGFVSARNITLRNYVSSSVDAIKIEGTLTSSKCGAIIIHDNTTSAATKDGVNVTGSISADGSLAFKNNSTTATGADGVHISSASAISVGGNVQFIGNAGKDAGHGVYISGTGIVKSLSNIMIRENSSDGTGHGFNVDGTATVSGFNIIIENNSSVTGKEVNIASTAQLHSCDVILIDHDVTVSDDISGILQGHIIICGNLTVDENITIRGDLTVKGSVTVNTGVTLTVEGNVLFDGQNSDNKVAVNGTGQISTRNITIQHYDPTTGVPVSIAGTIDVQHGHAHIIHNTAVAAATDAVNVTGTITASGDIKFSHNIGITTGDGVELASATVDSKGGSVIFTYNSTAGNGDGVNLSGATIVNALQDIVVRNNTSGGTGAGFNVDGTSSVTSNGHTHVKDNSSVVVAAGATFDTTNHTLIFDPTSGTTTVSTDFDHSGSVTGHVYVKGALAVDQSLIIDGDLTVKGDLDIDEDLAVTGNLVVLGGAVNLAVTKKLTVMGDIIFDGQGNNKNVVLEGKIVGATDDDSGVKNLIIKNYVLTGTTTMFAVSIAATGRVVALHDIQIMNNTGSTGTTGAIGVFGGQGVSVQGVMNAKGSMKFHHNVGGQGGQSTGAGMVGAIGGHGVIISAPITASETISFIDNVGGAGGISNGEKGGLGASAIYLDSKIKASDIFIKNNIGGTGQDGNGTNMNGGAGGVGALIATGSDVLAHATMVIADNTGGAGGTPTGTGSYGDGGNGASIIGGSTVEVDSVLSIRKNTGGATNTGGTSGNGFELGALATITVRGNKVLEGNAEGAANGGAAGLATNILGTCINISGGGGSSKFVYDGATATSTIGSVTGDVCVNGTLTVDSSIAIYGDLSVNGSVVTNDSGYTLTVHGDVVFDGQGTNKTVFIAPTDMIIACNILVQNYISTTDHAVNLGGAVIVSGDIFIKNNSTTAATRNGVIVSGLLTAISGTILFRENSSSTDHGVEISGTAILEAMHIHFTKNSSTEVDSHAVYIDDATVKAHEALRFTYNFGGATSGNGVVIGDTTATIIMAASLYVVVTCTAQRQHFVIDANTTKTDFYGATLLEFVSNTGTMCTVDITP